MTELITAILIGSTCLMSPLPIETDGGDNREALYEKGVTFDVFLDKAEKRKDRWHRNYETAQVNDELLVRVQAAGGRWKLLVVAVDGCSDSVSTIPFLARLAERSENIDMRIVDSSAGREVMLDHPTPDGRAATPTVVLLNEDYEEVGCFIERPAILQEWASKNREALSDKDFLEQKFAWYDRDAGQQTVDAVVRLLEEAANGATGC